ncbi:MAG TPA: hypothetical protein VGF25_07390 [Thermoleophilaceae bacterium]|jgi:hypothetical protein
MTLRLGPLALALSIAAAAAPSASARPVEQFLGPQPAPEARVVQESPSSGFDWGDAGIGAAAALGMIGAGGALVLTTRRRQTGAVTQS